VAVHKYKANESTDDTEVVEKTVKPATKAVATVKKTEKKVAKERKPIKFLAPFRAMWGYFVGSWQELRQVHWPNRKQTWAMTLAVLIFSVALGVLIFLLDALFTLLFKKFIF